MCHSDRQPVTRDSLPNHECEAARYPPTPRGGGVTCPLRRYRSPRRRSLRPRRQDDLPPQRDPEGRPAARNPLARRFDHSPVPALPARPMEGHAGGVPESIERSALDAVATACDRNARERRGRRATPRRRRNRRSGRRDAPHAPSLGRLPDHPGRWSATRRRPTPATSRESTDHRSNLQPPRPAVSGAALLTITKSPDGSGAFHSARGVSPLTSGI